MSLLLRTLRLNVARSSCSRAFTNSSILALKEDKLHSENQAEANEHHKQDQLQKQKEGKGEWKPELASNSEEAVKADQNKNNDSIEEMQKKTAEHAEKTHKGN